MVNRIGSLLAIVAGSGAAAVAQDADRPSPASRSPIPRIWRAAAEAEGLRIALTVAGLPTFDDACYFWRDARLFPADLPTRQADPA